MRGTWIPRTSAFLSTSRSVHTAVWSTLTSTQTTVRQNMPRNCLHLACLATRANKFTGNCWRTLTCDTMCRPNYISLSTVKCERTLSPCLLDVGYRPIASVRIGLCLLWGCNVPQTSQSKFGYTHSFGRSAFENGLQYRHSDWKILSGNISATFCTNMMKIGPVTPEITSVTNAFLDETAKIGISHQMSQQLLDQS